MVVHCDAGTQPSVCRSMTFIRVLQTCFRIERVIGEHLMDLVHYQISRYHEVKRLQESTQGRNQSIDQPFLYLPEVDEQSLSRHCQSQ